MGGGLIGALVCQTILSAPSFAQTGSAASANSAANSAGTTVNNQNNSQINTSAFYGFGPGINCPTPTFALSGFSGNGSGDSSGDVLGASVSSSNYGGVATVTIPLGGANQEICKEIGRAQIQALMSQVERSITEANKTQADINLVTAIKCVELMRVASLSGLYSELCRGVTPFGQTPMSVSPRTPAKISYANQSEPETAALIKLIPAQTGVGTRSLMAPSRTNVLTANGPMQTPATRNATASTPTSVYPVDSTSVASGVATAPGPNGYSRSVLQRYE